MLKLRSLIVIILLAAPTALAVSLPAVYSDQEGTIRVGFTGKNVATETELVTNIEFINESGSESVTTQTVTLPITTITYHAPMGVLGVTIQTIVSGLGLMLGLAIVAVLVRRRHRRS